MSRNFIIKNFRTLSRGIGRLNRKIEGVLLWAKPLFNLFAGQCLLFSPLAAEVVAMSEV